MTLPRSKVVQKQSTAMKGGNPRAFIAFSYKMRE